MYFQFYPGVSEGRHKAGLVCTAISIAAAVIHLLAIGHLTGAQGLRRIAMVMPSSGGGAWTGAMDETNRLCVQFILSVF